MARGDADSQYRAQCDVTAGSDRVFRTIRANGKATKTCRQGIAFEFFLNKTIQYSCHIDDTTYATDASYDMIIGRDLLSALAIDISFTRHELTREGISVPMKKRGSLRGREHAHELMLNLNVGVLTTEATSRIKQILDANYQSADLKQVTSSILTLDKNEQRELRVLLESFKYLFDCTLGDFDTAPVSIELLPGAIPYHARPYPVPVIHKETVRKEIQRLFDFGVLEKCNDSAHAAPTFIIAKKQVLNYTFAGLMQKYQTKTVSYPKNIRTHPRA